MKKKLKLNYLSIVMTSLIVVWSCSSSNDPTPVVPKPPPKIPEIPTSPGQPSVITPVSDIISGKFSKGDEVFLYGYLTRQKSNDDDEWYFSDDGGATEIILDFPTSQVPAVNKNMLVYGGVDDIGEVDVFSWLETDIKPTIPVPPPFPPAGVIPPSLVITTVDDIVKGVKRGEVIIAGQLTSQEDDDCDEWIFSDGTGSIEVEFQSCFVPALGVPIYIYGKTDGNYEVDVFSWMPQ